MPKMFLVICFIFSTSMQRSSYSMKGSRCPDYCDKECAIQLVEKIAKRKLGKRFNNYQAEIEEDSVSFVIAYIDMEWQHNSIKKGGNGLLFTISKADCEIIDYKRLK